MNELIVEAEIISKEKKEISNKRKMMVYLILVFLWIISTRLLNRISSFSVNDIWIVCILFCVLIFTSFAFKYIFFSVPSKGKLLLSNDYIILKMNKQSFNVKYSEIDIVRIYEKKSSINEVDINIELKSYKINFDNELSTMFTDERIKLRQLVEIWKSKGVNAEFTTFSKSIEA